MIAKHLLSELKLRPPKQQSFSASCKAAASRRTPKARFNLEP